MVSLYVAYGISRNVFSETNRPEKEEITNKKKRYMESIFILRAEGKGYCQDSYIIGKENVWPQWCSMQRFYDRQKIDVKVYSTFITSFGRIDRYEEKDPMMFMSNSNYALAE
jgi:hypothetical protein